MRAGARTSRAPKSTVARIAGDNLEPPGIGRGDIGKRRQAALVLLDGDDAGRTLHEQRSGEAAGPWADLDDGRAFERSRGAGDAAGEIEVEQEILAEAFPRGKPQVADDVAKRRQPVWRAQGVASAFRRIVSARRKASIRLRGLALPVPARAKAVPWSGEVRTKGSPSVTLTPVSKASVLTGISA